MSEEKYRLKNGERIPMEDGGEAVVGREIGSGGQGIVYIVKYQGVYMEIQIRTLFEEGWGEIDHHILYPYKRATRCSRNFPSF